MFHVRVYWPLSSLTSPSSTSWMSVWGPGLTARLRRNHVVWARHDPAIVLTESRTFWTISYRWANNRSSSITWKQYPEGEHTVNNYKLTHHYNIAKVRIQQSSFTVPQQYLADEEINNHHTRYIIPQEYLEGEQINTHPPKSHHYTILSSSKTPQQYPLG